MTDFKFTIGALRAAKIAQEHIKGNSFTYAPEETAVDIDNTLGLPQLLDIVDAMVEDAKRDLATTPTWTGNTVRINKSRLKELANLVSALRNG